MSSTTTYEAADPIAKGILPTAKQSLKDLFIWKQRVVVTNDYGEEHTEWQSPEKLVNPISLLAQLSARDVSYQKPLPSEHRGLGLKFVLWVTRLGRQIFVCQEKY